MKKSFALFYTLLCSTHFAFSNVQQPVILCTYFTESHKTLAHEWMLPSIKDDFTIIIGNGEQVCPNASYFSPGWTKTTLDKVNFIISVIENNMGAIVIFADTDIIFFRPIKKQIIDLLEEKEFVVQKDAPDKTLCSGFFALKANTKTLQLWQAVQGYMEKNSSKCDQWGLNNFLNPHKNSFDIAWSFLPTEHFCGGGTFKKRLWKPGRKAIVPSNVAMFHANYTHYQNKIAMLTYVKKIVTSRQKEETG